MTRQRQVFERAEVAHLWAHAAQPSARDKSGNFFFCGANLYSYGSHFVVARRCVRADGSVAYLWHDASFSVTTSRHQAYARQAIPSGALIVRAPRVDEAAIRSPDRLIAECAGAMAEYLRVAALARVGSNKRASAYADAAALHRDAQLIPSLFPDASSECKAAMRAALRKLPKLPADDSAESLAAIARDAWKDKANAAADLARNTVSRVRAAMDNGPGSWEMVPNRDERAPVESYTWDAAVKESDLYARRAGIRPPITKTERASFEETRAALAEMLASRRAQWARDMVRTIRQQMPTWDHAAVYTRALDYARRCAEYLSGDEQKDARSLIAEIESGYAVQAEKDRQAYAVRTMESAHALIRSAESYANAGHYPDALREHRRAARAIEDAHAINPALVAPELPDATEWEAAILRANAERVERWRAGAGDMYLSGDIPIMLRIVNDEIQTSRGARVPLSVAPTMWRLIGRARAESRDIEIRARIGHYALSLVRADGSAVIGCHDIGYPEFERVARALGYIGGDAIGDAVSNESTNV
jgi:tetratricopeptide (TPR) repeat protein